MAGENIKANKDKAVDFLQLVVGRNIEEAYQKYVDMQSKHHTAFFPAGFQTLQKGMIEDHAQFPNKHITIVNVLGEGDRVAVHSHLRRGPNDMADVHLFRFKDNKIVEMWDCGQALPADSPNADGVF